MATKIKTKPEETPEIKSGDLESRIRAGREEANAYIDSIAARIKAGPDGAILPIGIIRQMLDKNSRCHCLVALKLMTDKTYG